MELFVGTFVTTHTCNLGKWGTGERSKTVVVPILVATHKRRKA